MQSVTLSPAVKAGDVWLTCVINTVIVTAPSLSLRTGDLTASIRLHPVERHFWQFICFIAFVFFLLLHVSGCVRLVFTSISNPLRLTFGVLYTVIGSVFISF